MIVELMLHVHRYHRQFLRKQTKTKTKTKHPVEVMKIFKHFHKSVINLSVALIAQVFFFFFFLREILAQVDRKELFSHFYVNQHFPRSLVPCE